jgi:protein disulfide-isomerase A6
MVKSAPIAAVAASLLLCGADASLYTKSSPVLQVEGRSYDSLITQSNHTSIVEFYAPWCGHCKNLQPAYEKAAKSLAGLAKVAAVNCDEEANKPLCGRMGVQGFPTLKIVRPGKKPGKPSVEDYNGARSAKGIVDAVIDKIPNHVKRLKDSDYEEWTAAEGNPKAILFTDKGTVSALLRAVAIDFLGGLDVGQIRNKETKAVEAYEVTTFPTLILLPKNGKEPVKYDGELKKEAIVKFLSQAATPNPDPAPSKKKPKTEKSKTDKKKASSASSKFSKSSASQASKEANTDTASQTEETIVDNPTDSPSPEVEPEQKPVKLPKVAPSIVQLTEELSLQHKCLNDKAGTCVLALIPEDDSSEKTVEAVRSLSDLHYKHESAKRNLFPFYQLPASNAQATALRKQLDLSTTEVEIIAINGKRAWWRHYKGADFKLSGLEDWVDAIRMGDSPKQKVPEGLIVDASDLPAEPVKAKSNPEFEAFKESMKAQIPDGLDFNFDEIDDETWANIMKQSEEAPEAAAPPAKEKAPEAEEPVSDEVPEAAVPVDDDHDEL